MAMATSPFRSDCQIAIWTAERKIAARKGEIESMEGYLSSL